MGGALLTLLLGGFLTYWLVRSAPGYDTDSSELDGRRSAASVAAIRAQNHSSVPLWLAYAQYLAGVAHGEFGTSRAWDRSVGQLLLERGTVTLRAAGAGLLL